MKAFKIRFFLVLMFCLFSQPAVSGAALVGETLTGEFSIPPFEVITPFTTDTVRVEEGVVEFSGRIYREFPSVQPDGFFDITANFHGDGLTVIIDPDVDHHNLFNGKKDTMLTLTFSGFLSTLYGAGVNESESEFRLWNMFEGATVDGDSLSLEFSGVAEARYEFWIEHSPGASSVPVPGTLLLLGSGLGGMVGMFRRKNRG